MLCSFAVMKAIKKVGVTAIFILISILAQAQKTGIISGVIIDKNTQESIIGASVIVDGSSLGVSSDINGKYRLEVPVGAVRLKVSFIGYVTVTKENIIVSTGNAQIVNFELEPASKELSEVSVVFEKGRSAVATDMITPLSVQQLTTEEIKSSPGGGYDVSRVIQTLPGVGGSSSPAARNDIIIRGGAPNENVFYLDGIEIPVLNHFQTQGSNGGATGILNVSFIEDVKLSSSAFDARYDNALASTFVIRQREGNNEKLSGNIRLSGTEFATTLEGPLKKKTNFLASFRRSYLQYLFQALDLPIRPNFWDFQYKVTSHLNSKTTFSAIGLGAIDEFHFGIPKESTPENIYILRSQPYINQWNYTTGFSLKRLIENGFYNVSLSRNMFNNELDKYKDENKIEANRTYKLRSWEAENKFRFDFNKFKNGWKYSAGIMAQYDKYSADLFSRITNALTDSLGNVVTPANEIRFNSQIGFWKYGVFFQSAKNVLHDRLLLSFGLRSDMNSFLTDGGDPLSTLSPRLSLAYHLNPKVDITASAGRYFKIPTYTTLGFRDEYGELVNKNMKYIQSDHLVAGLQFLPKESLRFTLEGFYKKYSNYPVSVADGISLANTGDNFGSVGSERISSTGQGECYGFEIFAQQKLINRIFYVISYTFFHSRYTGVEGKYISSSWDNRHLLSATLGYKFKKNWELGLKYRLAGGAPYTPFEMDASRSTYLLLGTGTLDYSKLNTLRLNTFSQLDVRLDKKINYKRTSLDLFIDIQNILLQKQESTPYYTFKRNADNTDFETTDGASLKSDGSNAIPYILENNSLSVTPSIGIVFEF